jgi:hypothetical protein
MAVGRISGPLLKSNLLRDGVDLAFETDLLYLDVNNGRVGINTATPDYDLDVNGTVRSTNAIVDTQTTIATFTVSGNTIASSNSTINLEPSGANAVVYQGKLQVNSNLQLTTNAISTTVTDANLEFNTIGAGQVNINSNTLIDGNLHVTGNLQVDGDSAGQITIGDSNTDAVNFKADVASNIIPDNQSPLYTPVYDLGSTSKRWANVYTTDIQSTSITSAGITINGINLELPQGNIYYVATTGSDTNAGEHENNPVLTLKYALSLAGAGDTVYIYPGVYTEIFPLTIPVGVAIKGSGIRAVTIQPTVGTVDKDAFLLNGETTVEDLTVTGFRYNGTNNTGYGFRFATGFRVTTRSPYIKNVTVLTRGSVTSGSDPYGFDQNDAGKGAFVDGSIANVLSKEASMLFHSVTFFTPNQETIVATNGVRIEWLNSFSYFADKGFYAYSSATGFAGAGATRLRIDTRTGTWNVGNTLSYYDTDGTTVLGTGTIASIDGDYVNLTGRCLGFETITDRAGKPVYAQGNAKLSNTQAKFNTTSLALDGTGDYLSTVTQPDFAFPSTISRLAKTITANGNAAVSATQSKFGGSSIAFDGTGDYLSLATSTDFGFGTGDFTIEGWIYKTTTTTQYLFDTRTTLTENSVAIQSNGSGNLRLFVNGTFVLTSSNAHTNNAWNHVAICRASGITRAFINGVASTTTYTDATNYGTTKPLVVGAQYNGTTAFNGYIDDFRVSNTARYPATFTPTTTAFVDDVNTKLLVNGNSTIVDDASYGTATDFTIEGWIYPTAGSVYRTLFDFRSAAIEKSIYLGINTSNQVYLYVNGVITITTAATVSLSAWTHVALVRSNASTKIYLNGTQSGSSWADITDYGTTKPLRIGADWTASYGFTGYIDDVKISKGVARYTTTFTAPTTALTGDLGTVLLLHFNGANNSTTILDDGVTLQDLRTSAGGTATLINFADYSDFGAEIRSIGSASIYGNYGVYGDGIGVIGYFVSHNVAYVGAGKLVTNDPNDRIAANEFVQLNGAKIYHTAVDNEGNFTVGDGFSVNQKTGEVVFNGQLLTITSATGVTFTDGVNTTTITPADITTGNIRIHDNNIDSLTGNIIVTAASGAINLQNNTFVTGNLDVTGNVNIGGNIQIGDQTTDTVSFVAGINSNLVPATTALYDLGTASLRWNNAYLSRLEVDGLVIDSNTISTTIGNDNLTLSANGTGKIVVPSNDVQFDQNLTVGNNLTVTTGTTYLKNTTVVGTITQTGNIVQTGNITTSGDLDVTGHIISTGYLQLPQVRIENNVVSTTGTDLQLQANGGGNVIIENIKVTDNNIQSISTNSDIILTPQGTGNVIINNTQSLQIPAGNGTTDRPGTPHSGMLRFNTDLNRYEGYNGSYWQTLSGVEDTDGNTKIIAEATPGANDNTLYFYADGNLMVTIDSTKLFAERLQTSNMDLNGSTITSITTNSDLNLTATGTGGVRLGNLRIYNNSITNVATDAITEFTSTGTGYVKFAGTNGVVIPSGDGALDRPLATEIGMTRFNTTGQLVEVFDGVSWTSVAGASGGVTTLEATSIGITSALIFG